MMKLKACWFGGIQTFKRLGLVAEDKGAEEFTWGSKTYYLTKDYEKLNSFVLNFMKFESEHVRPTANCSLEDVSIYSRNLGCHFSNALKLGKQCNKYIRPHAVRKIFLRHEDLTRQPPSSEYYAKIEAIDEAACDDRIIFWRSKTLDELSAFAPDSHSHLDSYPAETTLLRLAMDFNMHPLLVSCWSCLIGKAVADYGFEQTLDALRDDNETTISALDNHVSLWGEELPPSMSRLMQACGHNKRRKLRHSRA